MGLLRRIVPARPTYVSMIYKYVLFLSNFIFWLMSIAMLGIGTYVWILKNKATRDSWDIFTDPSVWITIVGALTFVISALGWWGALRENQICLLIYMWILRVLFFLQLLCATMMFVIYYAPSVRKKLNLNPKTVVEKSIIKYRDDQDLKNLLDYIQKTFECCGIGSIGDEAPSGYQDWSLNVYFNCSPTNPSYERCHVPYSCCRFTPNEVINRMCGANAQTKEAVEVSDFIYTAGCAHTIAAWTTKNSLIVGALALAVLIPQIFFSYLAQNLDDQVYQQRTWPPLDNRPCDPTQDAYMPPEANEIVHKYRSPNKPGGSDGRSGGSGGRSGGSGGRSSGSPARNKHETIPSPLYNGRSPRQNTKTQNITG